MIVPAVAHLLDKALMTSCDARSIDLSSVGMTFDCVRVFGSDMPDELMEFLVFSKEVLATQQCRVHTPHSCHTETFDGARQIHFVTPIASSVLISGKYGSQWEFAASNSVGRYWRYRCSPGVYRT